LIILKLSIILLFFNFILYNLGFFFFRSEKDKSSSVFIGFTFLLTFISFLYFILDLHLYYIKFILLSISLIFFIYNLKFKNFIIDYLEILKIILIPTLLIIIIFYQHGEQFFIFRGNHYDALNYTSLAVMIHNFHNSEILSLINKPEENKYLLENFFYLNNAVIIFETRPLVSLFNALFYFPNFLKLHEANFIFKTSLIILIPIAVNNLLNFLSNKTYKINFLCSQIFSLSFWVIYIIEIDANSQLASFALSIYFVYFVLKNNNIFINLNIKNIIFFSIISATFFSLYAEQAIIFFLITFIFFIIKNIKNFKYYNLYLSIVLFCIILTTFLIPHQYLYKFLIQQANIGINSSNDWWGYFGAFILGSNNIILNTFYITEIKRLLSLNDFIFAIKYIHHTNSLNYGGFYWLNIFPSLFGFYTINGVFNYDLSIVFNILISLILIYLLSCNVKVIFKEKNDINLFLKIIFFFSFIFITILIIRLSFWFVIKYYFYLSFFIFLLMIYNLLINKNKNKNILVVFLLFFLPIVPFYKFTEFNYGIGKYDSLPSVLNVKLKTEYDWTFDVNNFKDCETIYIKSYDRYINTILSYKFSYNGMNNIKFLNILDNDNKDCKLNIKN